ncbi:LacI family DNA-binding transcriptional regulator [Bifidobacterium saguinibicoloris]|uniref:LacI family DNA-binding transcriptional regulator n=1 Tax=Bifidobacterium saguinibicoloris TaxID=2834433 RepID=UPI001C56EBEF|nr:LacI family DNA-binding transcriptional regulator [Bifidobacterium saguinibicoloris]MBW3080567.1 LacI family DNA-binding transcriptional regulator [Bifidobacterium saguinibicoloris]
MSIIRSGTTTIADVAEAAGVSRSTASRALNDSPRISERTKQLVREAADRIGFVPNAQARALAVGRSETIAMLVTEPLPELFADPTYGVFLGGITERLSESEYLPVLLQASTHHERERVRRHLERKSFDAVIDISPYTGSELLDVLQRLHIPTVLCGQLDGQPYEHVFSTIYSDDVVGAKLAADAMAARGRTRPVAILGPKDNPASTDRVEGYRSVYGTALGERDVVYTGWGASDGFTAMLRLLDERASEGDSPTCGIDGVLAGSDRIAAGVIEALQGRGICVPDDVSVIGFDDHPIAMTTTPKLTTIHQPLYEEGRLAADTAMRMIDGEAPGTTVLQMTLVERESL